MGINPQPDIELYWSISGTMNCKRFKKNLEHLHVCDNTIHLPRNHKDHDKLEKVRPLLNFLNRTFQDNATNSQTQSMDESMIKFQVPDSKKQYMLAKPIKRGFKVWCRCDSKTGYLYQFDTYTGKDQATNEEGLGYRVVMKLAENLPPYTHLVFDNFFSSLALMEALYHRGIFATGTVRIHRKGIPKELFYIHTLWIKWQDAKEVFVLSTAVNPTKVEVIQRT
ncbi:hypothetical protein ABMA28_009133 [Loxostege sticticalis]|uniref:PiggyBac transposable element-derived protein domain-containing protein n=1 Tax=Loxostege sticticalis TaxID=481309 RepID=A0ABD0SD76_LOXSC